MTRQHLLGLTALLSSAFLYGFFAIFTRTVGFELPLFFASFSRNLIGLVFLLIPMIVWGKWKKMKGKDVKWFAFRGLGGLFGFVGSYLAFYNMGIGITYFIFYASTAVSGYIMGSVFFGERITVSKLVSLFLAFLGLAFIYSFNLKDIDVIYGAYAALSGVGSALWNICSKKISYSYPAIQLNFIDFGVSLIFSFILSITLKEMWVMPAASSLWGANILFSLMFVVTGQLMIYGFKYIEAQTGTLIMLSEVVFGILLGYVFYHEVMGWYTVIGGLFIMGAIALPEMVQRKRAGTSKP